jgi:hypothetical protein
MDTTRLKQLSGVHPQRAVLEELRADRQQIVAAYDQVIREVEQGKQLDEGLFTSLKATLATVGQLGAAGAKKVKDAAKKIADDVKEIYLDNKAREELTQLVKNMKKVGAEFEKMEKDSVNIIQRDEEIREAMKIFMNLFKKTAELLAARQSLAMKTEGLLDQQPFPTLTDVVDEKTAVLVPINKAAFEDTKPQ